MSKKTKLIVILLVLFSIPFLSGCGSSAQQSYSVNLEIWGIFDDSMTYSEVINQYKKINPYVGEIKYRKMNQDTYKQDLLDALASGQGPDIFLINNTWLPSFENKLAPAPTPLVNDQIMKDNFPDVVAQDFSDNGLTYALPLSVDSLALYYNKDMFNAAGITTPPRTWQQFNDDVRKLTVIDPTGKIIQSGAALGTAKNVNRASDILSLLMFQYGVNMPQNKTSQVEFDQGVLDANGNVVQAGEQALGYYTNFARLSSAQITNAANPLYSWNNNNHDSVTAFSEGSVAMMVNYSWQVANIKSKNPKLNFGVAYIPQVNLSQPISYANYWGYAVSLNKLSSASSLPVQSTGLQSQAQAQPSNIQNSITVPNEVRIHEAWQFLKFLALKNNGTVTLYNAITKNSKDFPMNYDPALNYLKRTGQPAARRDLIDAQKSDSTLAPFVSGNLVAKSWYQTNPDAIEQIFDTAIESVDRGDTSLHDALTLMSNRVSHLSGSVSR
ncbi:MAG TPA: extracellular solute-binding protein [Patescibacteria group bacterium]